MSRARSCKGLPAHEGAGLPLLAFLGVHRASRLTSLRGLETLSHLGSLEVNDCRKIRSIEPIAALGGLRSLQLCNDGQIETLAPVAGEAAPEAAARGLHGQDALLRPAEQLPQA
ncbi:MAG TPA: hypothetical protein VHM31_15635 [Polyangia bacterium]|nr:hypothetical protein [Polyangia bacterium]